MTLSCGQKRLPVIGPTLAVDPGVLLLDEPMAGIAHEETGPVTDLIRRSVQGRTVLMMEHNLSVVRDLGDTIGVLQRHEVISEGTYAHVSADPRVREACIGSGACDGTAFVPREPQRLVRRKPGAVRCLA